MTTPPVLLVTGGMGYIGQHVLRQATGWAVHATWFNRPPADLSPIPSPMHRGVSDSPFPGREGGRGVRSLTWHHLDICNAQAVHALIRTIQPSVILHTAYQFNTPDMERVIIDGTRHVAAASASIGSRLVYLSTDVVFDGKRGQYRETDTPNPVHAYGRAKLVTETDVTRLVPGAAIVRTSLVYGFDPPDSRTLWVVDTTRERGNITLFTDEYRCPIYAPDLADALLELAQGDFSGLLHVAGAESLNRYEFGVLLCHAFGVDPAPIHAAPAPNSSLIRPLDCTLDISLAQRVLRTPLRGVHAVLKAMPPPAYSSQP